MVTRMALADNGGAERLSTIASAGAALAIDPANGNMFDITLDNATACALTVAALAHTGAGVTHALTLIIRQDATGGRTIDWSGMTILWDGASGEPTLSTAASAIDVITLLTVDDGTTWFGFVSGQAMQ